VPESPRWLMQHKRDAEAEATLLLLRNSDSTGVSQELSGMQRAGAHTHCTWGEVSHLLYIHTLKCTNTMCTLCGTVEV
jgi:Sugar (and other) transporter